MRYDQILFVFLLSHLAKPPGASQETKNWCQIGHWGGTKVPRSPPDPILEHCWVPSDPFWELLALFVNMFEHFLEQV